MWPLPFIKGSVTIETSVFTERLTMKINENLPIAIKICIGTHLISNDYTKFDNIFCYSLLSEQGLK